MKLPFCRAALLAAALGACLVGCKPAATDEPAAFATAETAEVAATLTPTAATTAQPVAAEIGTVLPATEDAGRSYLDETLFIGDSNTVRYTMYADETGTAFASVDNSIGVVSMGAGAITTLKCEKFKGSSAMYTVPDAVAMLKPQRIIICYGTNNLGGSSTDATSYIKTYLQGLQAIQTAWPYCDIIVSAIPQLESRTVTGETLPLLLERDGARLSGDYADEAFPLLLKLLAARDSLSVQVHPDDAYAREHEGKLGKTEAWVILKAEEGASILYGLKEGVTLEALRAALEGGGDVERLIRRVPVKPGDVYYMPSGMVHAIGGGILLYEIQQSSDVTYRLWDFARVNAAGEKRPLHIRQSLDVIVPELTGQIAHMPENDGCGLVTLLDVPAFHLECANVNGECELAPQPHAFRMLTALAGLLLSWQGDAIELKAGDSVLLPASCPPVTLMGVGQALISTPPARS